MKLIEMTTLTDKKGFLIIHPQLLVGMGIKPNEEIRLTYVSESGEMDNTHAQFVITPEGIAAKLLEHGEEDDSLALPHDLMKAAQIPLDSDLEVLCTAGAIVILASDILDELPDELAELFEDLGVSPDTVRGVMRNGGACHEQD
jgi:hypothetical protein